MMDINKKRPSTTLSCFMEADLIKGYDILFLLDTYRTRVDVYQKLPTKVLLQCIINMQGKPSDIDSYIWQKDDENISNDYDEFNVKGRVLTIEVLIRIYFCLSLTNVNTCGGCIQNIRLYHTRYQ